MVPLNGKARRYDLQRAENDEAQSQEDDIERQANNRKVVLFEEVGDEDSAHDAGNDEEPEKMEDLRCGEAWCEI